MLFVSKNQRLRLIVRTDETEVQFSPHRGQALAKTLIEPVYAEFRPWGIPNFMRDFAVAYFEDPGNNPSEWTPSGITGIGDTRDGILATPQGSSFYEGQDPRLALGVLDTSVPDHVRPENRELVEQYLLNSRDRGVLFIYFNETMPRPWSSYNKLKATTSDLAKLIQRIEDDDLDVDYVIRFETENENRTTVLKALEDYKAKLAV